LHVDKINASQQRNTNHGKKKMNYRLSPAQKNILAANGKNVNFCGDDNDFGCIMSQIAIGLYMAGKVADAWNCYQNDPTACYGVTFSAWESGMKSMVIRCMQDDQAASSHAVSMAKAG
jgi:hypothetical protein